MSPLNGKLQAAFCDWLDNMSEDDLQLFVFGNKISKTEFGSEDFKLHYSGVSKGVPAECHMIEARISTRTKDKQLKRLLQISTSVARDPTRLAFVLVPTSMDGHCIGQHVKQALQESPVKGKTLVNKVHVQWAPAVKFEGGKPRFAASTKPFVFEKIPFEGYNADGTIAAKKGRGGKK